MSLNLNKLRKKIELANQREEIKELEGSTPDKKAEYDKLQLSNEYFYSIFSGMVIAIGGLSETIVRESSNALLKYVRVHIANNTNEDNKSTTLILLTNSILQMRETYEKDDRVMVPLLKTLNLLLKNNIFDTCSPRTHTFIPSLLEALIIQANGANVSKICLCVDAYIHLLLFHTPFGGCSSIQFYTMDRRSD